MTELQPSADEPLFAHVPYEYGAIAPRGAILYTAGACPLDSEGKVVGLNDPIIQAGVALDNLVSVLDRFGARTAGLVKTTEHALGCVGLGL